MFQKATRIKLGDRVCLLDNAFGKHACGTMLVDNIVPVNEDTFAELEEAPLTGQSASLGDFVIVGRVTPHGDFDAPKKMASVVIKPNSEICNLGPLNSGLRVA